MCYFIHMSNKSTILVVEDEPLLLESIAKKLTISEMTPLPCPSGEAGIQTLKKLKTMPDAIWLDYQLSDMDGITFMNKLKEEKAWTEIPVVVVSNSVTNEKVYNMLALGAKQYLLKAEHRLDDIIKTVQRLIKERSTN